MPPSSILEHDFPRSHVDAGGVRAKSQIDAVLRIEAVGPQRDPLLRCLSSEIILREIGPIDGWHFLAAYYDKVSLVSLATQFLGRREACRPAAHDDDLGWRSRRHRTRCSVGFQQLLLLRHEDSVVAPLDLPSFHLTDCRSVQGLSGPQAEPGVMPGTPHGVSDHQPIRGRTAVMGTAGADR